MTSEKMGKELSEIVVQLAGCSDIIRTILSSMGHDGLELNALYGACEFLVLIADRVEHLSDAV